MINPDKKKYFETVRSMRQKGLSLHSISVKTGVPNSTIRLWCRDIILSKLQADALTKKHRTVSSNRLIQIQNRRRRIIQNQTKLLIQAGKRDFKINENNPLFFLGLGLYWGEGYKKGNKEIGITNSDPKIINIALTWFRSIYKIKNSDIVARLSINESYKDDEKTILEYWSKTIQLPPSQFTKTSFIKEAFKRIYPDRSHKGTLRIKVLTPSRIRERILSSIAAVENYIK